MTETSQLQSEQINHQASTPEDENGPYPQSRGRDWLLRFLLFALLLTLTALALGSLGLLAAFLLGYNLQLLKLTLPRGALPLLSTLTDALNLLQLALILLAGLLVWAFFLYLLVRWRIVRKQALWPEAGCPACRHETVVRVRRRPKDRLYTWIGIPVGRYHCRECRWNGLRIRRGQLDAHESEAWSEAVDAVSDSGLAATTSRQHSQSLRTVAANDEAMAQWAARADNSAAAAAALAVDEATPTVEADDSAKSEEGQTPPPNGEADHEPGLAGERRRPEVDAWGQIVSPFGLNLRADPQSDASLVGLLDPGTNVRLLEKVTANDGSAWQHVQVDDRQGWVLSTFLKRSE